MYTACRFYWKSFMLHDPMMYLLSTKYPEHEEHFHDHMTQSFVSRTGNGSGSPSGAVNYKNAVKSMVIQTFYIMDGRCPFCRSAVRFVQYRRTSEIADRSSISRSSMDVRYFTQ